MPEQKTDAVIEAARAAADKARTIAANARERLEERKKHVVNQHGVRRPHISMEVAQRQIEMEALEDRVEELERAVEHAIADLPRREQERAAAEKLDAEVAALDGEVADALQKLQDLQGRHRAKRADADAARHRASRVADQLASTTERAAAAAEKAEADAAWMAQADAALMARRRALAPA